ncbi:MAG: hypothetical protein ACREDR_45275, partial [Blastocatellia bacterium]
EWTVGVRFNKPELIQRIRKIGRYSNRIRIYQSDALEFIDTVVSGLGKNSFAFFDPPYIENGQNLYLNEYTLRGHRRLAERIVALEQPWLVTYDYSAVRHNLFRNHRRVSYGLGYTARERYEGKEVMFIANGLKLPADWGTSKTVQMSSPTSEHPLYGKMESMKPRPDMIEGPEAFERFRQAVKKVLAVPKSAVPNPFGKRAKKKKPTPKR